MHTIDDPIYISAPCKIYPVSNGDLPNFDILQISKIMPCTLELRSDFFIENFEMSEPLSPNDFVLLDGKILDFASHIDFYFWSKRGLAI